MATFAVTPADLSIICVQGDELNISFVVDIDDMAIDLSEYAIASVVYVPTPSSGGSWAGADGLVVGATAASFTINAVDLEDGKINMSLTEVQIGALSPATSYRWYLRWTDTDSVTRTVVAGDFTVRIP